MCRPVESPWRVVEGSRRCVLQIAAAGSFLDEFSRERLDIALARQAFSGSFVVAQGHSEMTAGWKFSL